MSGDAEATVAKLWSEDWLDAGKERHEDPRGCYDDVHKGSVVKHSGYLYRAVRKESRVVYGWRAFLVEVWDGETPLCDHMLWRNAYELEVTPDGRVHRGHHGRHPALPHDRRGGEVQGLQVLHARKHDPRGARIRRLREYVGAGWVLQP